MNRLARWIERKNKNVASQPQAVDENMQYFQARADDVRIPYAPAAGVHYLQNPVGCHDLPTRIYQDSTCQRCYQLHIGSEVEANGEVPYGTIATIRQTSLHADCILCTRFQQIFSFAYRKDNGDSHIQELDLAREDFSILDERGRYHGQYMSIRFKHIPTFLRLFPSHGSFKKAETGLHQHLITNEIDRDRPDYALARQWLKTCHRDHTKSCTPSYHPTNLLRLIDCRTRKISPAAGNQPYICLSYVWGSQTASEFSNPAVLPDEIPQTVEDAM